MQCMRSKMQPLSGCCRCPRARLQPLGRVLYGASIAYLAGKCTTILGDEMGPKAEALHAVSVPFSARLRWMWSKSLLRCRKQLLIVDSRC